MTTEPQVLDENVVRGLVEMGSFDPAFYPRLIDKFAESSAATVRDMRAAIASGNAQQVRELGHGLKGAALQLGATEAGAIARDIELAPEGAAFGGSVDALESALARAVDALRSFGR